jgi:hypothetical protein
MCKVLLLATGRRRTYWNSPKEADYSRRSYKDLPEWESLARNCPLPGIGIYIKQKQNDFSSQHFVYLKVKGMRYDPNSEMPYFDFEPVGHSKTPSRELVGRLGDSERVPLFSVKDCSEILTVLQALRETPPSAWKDLLSPEQNTTSQARYTWEDYIGKYFLDIKDTNISNNEFEDRVCALLTAIGFEVEQRGHRVPGEYPDGIAFVEGYGLVYDCKNSTDYRPTTDDKRAIRKYLEDEKKAYESKTLFPVFIAKSFRSYDEKDIYHLDVEALNYLLYKKICLGSKFNLSRIKKLLDNKTTLNRDIIDNEWL